MSPGLHRLGEIGSRYFRWLSGTMPERLELHLIDDGGNVIKRVPLGVVSCRIVGDEPESDVPALAIRVPVEGEAARAPDTDGCPDNVFPIRSKT